MTTTADAITRSPVRNATLHVALWIAQLILAVLFAGAGYAKAMTPLPELAQSLPYTADLPGGLVRFIGLSEMAGAVALIVPALSRIVPMLTPLAGGGLCLIMVLATLFHLSRGEFSAIAVTVVLALVAVFVAWGRSRRAPILPRT